MLVGTVLFLAVVLIYEYGQAGGSTYLMLKSLHFHLSRYGLGMALAMLVIAFVLGIIRKDDVTPWFRRGTYVVFGSMVIQTVSFIFVEVTASKRPSMGSYIWGFFLMVGVIVRCFGTGPSA
ncbi:MAG: hypothetical protein MUC99_01770 [Anaerolineae bacterium]|nr:hypothetical protein [Anaerolineae bacterium]